MKRKSLNTLGGQTETKARTRFYLRLICLLNDVPKRTFTPRAVYATSVQSNTISAKVERNCSQAIQVCQSADE